MTALKPRYSKEDFARRGQAICERDIRPHIKAGDQGKFVAIDIETGAYEIDRDDYTATERLLARSPTAQVWLLRVGHRAAYRIGGRPVREANRLQHHCECNEAISPFSPAPPARGEPGRTMRLPDRDGLLDASTLSLEKPVPTTASPRKALDRLLDLA